MASACPSSSMILLSPGIASHRGQFLGCNGMIRMDGVGVVVMTGAVVAAMTGVAQGVADAEIKSV